MKKEEKNKSHRAVCIALLLALLCGFCLGRVSRYPVISRLDSLTSLENLFYSTVYSNLSIAQSEAPSKRTDFRFTHAFKDALDDMLAPMDVFGDSVYLGFTRRLGEDKDLTRDQYLAVRDYLRAFSQFLGRMKKDYTQIPEDSGKWSEEQELLMEACDILGPWDEKNNYSGLSAIYERLCAVDQNEGRSLINNLLAWRSASGTDTETTGN